MSWIQRVHHLKCRTSKIREVSYRTETIMMNLLQKVWIFRDRMASYKTETIPMVWLHNVIPSKYWYLEMQNVLKLTKNLQRHKIIHSRLKTYLFSYSKKLFTQIVYFQRHKRFYTGHNKFSYTDFRKSFIQTEDLQKLKMIPKRKPWALAE